MKKIIDRIFSEKYVNHIMVTDNILLLMMYRFAYPFAALLNKLHFSPNQITTQSLLFSILAFIALAYDEGWGWFSIFWGLSILLDFCDGTVARMADKVSKSAFRYDHMSDLFKLSLIMMGTALRYHDYLIWCLAFSASFALMYCDALNQALGCATKHTAKPQKSSDSETSSIPHVRLRDRNSIIAWIVRYDWLLKTYKNIYTALLTVNGHTLLLFFIFPLSKELATFGLSYFIIIELLAIRSRIITLVAMRR